MILVEELSFTYPGADAPAVNGLSFEVREGEVFGFLGPSGAGKSTTQNILIGLLRGFGGTIDVLDKPLSEWGADYYRHIGVSFELPNHYLKLTARENLDYFLSLHEGDTFSAAEVLALVGLEGDIDKPVSDFSKGMKNRLSFARSLLHKPKLWFLDEPTAGLDPANAVNIRELVRTRQSEGVTTLITTHDMHTAEEICDRVAFIVDGRIAVIDAPDNLRRAHGKRSVEVRWRTGDSDERAEFALDGLADDDAFLEALRQPNVISVHSQETTLEDVFLEVTGRALS